MKGAEQMTPTIARRQRILVADDDPVVRLIVASIVKNEGYTPVAVEDGREAYRVLQADADFGAAIFDMAMPHLKGMDVIRYMRTEKRLMRIPVMLVTSEREVSLMAESFAAGVAVFLPKPFTTEQLQLMLRMLIAKGEEAGRQHRRAQDRLERPAGRESELRRR
jgi:CheY-like chemotaxis protein